MVIILKETERILHIENWVNQYFKWTIHKTPCYTLTVVKSINFLVISILNKKIAAMKYAYLRYKILFMSYSFHYKLNAVIVLK